MFQRVIVLILDSVGIGALPDAREYGDGPDVNTLANLAAKVGLSLPVLTKMGLGCIAPLSGVQAVSVAAAAYGKMIEQSQAKDTTSGHWEIAGHPVQQPFPVYPEGFPADLLARFLERTGCQGYLGNKPASGTVILDELGAEHMETGYPIIYTSADSVFQIAAHEDVIPLERLYELCRIAREEICIGEHAVGRIIARPFIGQPGAFVRTPNRHDYSLEPAQDTVLDRLQQAGYPVVGVGKIGDIFAQKGITESYPTKSNDQGMELALQLVRTPGRGLIMINLVEFDSQYGHRNDARGYAKALERFDGQLALFLPELQAEDLLIITADHGCDPTAPGTDHTREYVPLLVYHKGQQPGISLGVRTTFADVAATIADNFSLPSLATGTSFLSAIK